jgi:hypothetical protein
MELYEQIYWESHAEAAALLPPEAHEAGRSYEPLEAYVLLEVAYSRLLSTATEFAQRYNQYQWLYYLRRIPTSIYAFRRHSPNGPSFDQRVCEAITGSAAPGGGPTVINGRLFFPETHESLRDTLKLVSYGHMVSWLHRAMKRAAKGQAFIAHATGLPDPLASDPFSFWIDLYDERNAVGAHSGSEGSLGLVPWDPEADVDESLGFVLAHRVPSGTDVAFWRGPLGEATVSHRAGQYSVATYSSRALGDLIDSGGGAAARWWDEDLPALAILLLALGAHITVVHPNAGESLPLRGYYMMPQHELEEAIDAMLTLHSQALTRLFGDAVPASVGEVLATAESLEVAVTPLKPGPVLRRFNNEMIVDLASATDRFQWLARVSSQAEARRIVKARGDAFERDVQTAVDLTSWKPGSDDPARGLRIRRSNGEEITDLDSLAVKDGRLLAISCKSYPYTYDIYAGEFNAVRNRRDQLSKDLIHWEDRVAQFPNSPSHNFARYSEIIGIVVTPDIPFTTDAHVLEIALTRSDGRTLRRVCSIGELSAFLA